MRERFAGLNEINTRGMYRTVEKLEGGTQLDDAGVDGRLTFKLVVIKRFCRPRFKCLRQVSVDELQRMR
jgi:hypothetical protein